MTNFETYGIGICSIVRTFPVNSPVEYVTLLLRPMVDKRNRLQGFLEPIFDVAALEGFFPPVKVEHAIMLKRILSGLADRKEITMTLRKLGVVDESIIDRLQELNLVKGAEVVKKPRGLYKDVIVEQWGDETEEHGWYYLSLERRGGKYCIIETEDGKEISCLPQPGLAAGRIELRQTVELIEKLDKCHLKLFIQN